MAEPTVPLSESPDVQIVSLAARVGRYGDFAARLSELLQTRPPEGPRRATAGGASLLGVGPGRWLAVRDGSAPLYEALARPLQGLAAVCDQGDGYAVFSVEGSAARRVLSKGVPVDLHPTAFGPDAVAVTLVAHTGAIVWRTEAGFRIAVFRSYRDSFRHWLDEAAAEFTTTPDEGQG